MIDWELCNGAAGIFARGDCSTAGPTSSSSNRVRCATECSEQRSWLMLSTTGEDLTTLLCCRSLPWRALHFSRACLPEHP